MGEAHDLVWYAAYGSNLAFERFMAYIQGGIPEGSTRRHRGCADSTPPRADRPCRIPHRLYFARQARSWGGGGVAFVRPEAEPEHAALGRRYLVTRAQLVEILEQENGVERGAFAAEVTEELLGDGEPRQRVALPEGWYDLLLCIGRAPAGGPDAPEVPVWTFTGSRDLSGEGQAPSAAYLGTIGMGLLESYWGVEAGPDRLSVEELEESLLAAVPEHPGREAKVSTALRRTLPLVVGRTTERGKAGRTFIAQLHPDDRRLLGLGRRRGLLRRRARSVILEAYHGRKTLSVRAVLHVPRRREGASSDLLPGTVNMDQKLRQALGVQLGDRVMVRRPEGRERKPKERRNPLVRLAHRVLQAFGGVQSQIMRVQRARYADMEIAVCRIPATGFDVLGLEPGDYVVIESVTAKLRMRALEATDGMQKTRAKRAKTAQGVEDCHDTLSLWRSPTPDADLPMILMDFDARQALSVTPCESVYVYRDVVSLLWKQLRVLGLTLILSASVVIFQLDLRSQDLKLGLFLGAIVFGLTLVLFEIRKRIS